MKILKVIVLNLFILTVSLLAIIAGGRIDAFLGFYSFQSPLSISVGFFSVAVGVFLRSWTAFTYYEYKLRVLDLRAQHVLLQHGPFAYSRNPLYISIVTIILGCALILGTYVGVLFALFSFISWHIWVSWFEEHSLQEKFGRAYEDYKRTVPRWLGRWANKQSSASQNRTVWFASACVVLVILIFTVPLSVTSFVFIHCPSHQAQNLIEDHTTEISDLTVLYRTAGNPSAQPVVFLHGWGATFGKRCSTDHVIDVLAQHYYVIAPEHPGLVRSEAPKVLWSYDDYAQELGQLLHELGIQKPIVIGQSFGGGIASAYAIAHPREISALVLVDSVTTNRPHSIGMRIKHGWDKLMIAVLRSPIAPKIVQKMMIKLYLGTPLSFVTDDTISEQVIMPQIDIYKDLHKPLSLNYGDISVPFLLVWGDKDTWNTPIQRAREIHKEVRDSELIVAPGTHTVLYQRPQEILNLILSKLQ